MPNDAAKPISTTVYLNGEFIPKDRAVVSVDDRGFTFGDGIYEVVRIVDGALFEWSAHAARMTESLAGLRIGFSAERVAAIPEIARRLVAENQLATGEATLYIAVTRGSAPRAHAFPTAPVAPTIYITATRFIRRSELRVHGVAAITTDDLRWDRCNLKTLNLLGSVLARQQAAEAGAYDAILVRDGFVTEGAATNVFAVVDGVLRTHPLGNRVLPGITRMVVLACARELAIPVAEDAITADELRRAGEVFLTGTMTDIAPVIALDGVQVGDGRRGPITLRLCEALDQRMRDAR